MRRVEHKALIAENDPAPLMRSHLIQKDTPIAWRNWSWDTQEPIAFHNQGWRKASSGGKFFEFAHRLQHKGSELYAGWRRRLRLFLSQINCFASEDLEY